MWYMELPTDLILVWVQQKESFYCGLSECDWNLETTNKANITHYNCKKLACDCVPGRMLCGENGSIDLTDFLKEEIKGPASFDCTSNKGGKDDCSFSEENMNDLIKSVFGDKMIYLSCTSGECIHRTEIPGYKRPVKEINTPLIAGVIAGCSLLLVAVVLVIWNYSRKSSHQQGLDSGYAGQNDDDEANKLMAEHKPATLYFEDISYAANGKQILTDVSGGARPGQVMAIMGPSGAGKTTFLDILARKNKRGLVGGNVYVNGVKVSDDEFRSVIGFVDQEDTLMPTLTVYETVMYSALLRLPRDMAFTAKKKRVLDVIRELGIFHIKDSMIGSADTTRGISGGERRRVSIACELVTSPSIIFLDEPTSGLDSYNAYNVVESLVTLAQDYNRTVIFTIHQPRSNIVALFDQLVLLAKGRTVYSGEYSKCQKYFADLGYPCPPGFNIADYLVDLTMHASHGLSSNSSSDNNSVDDSAEQTGFQRFSDEATTPGSSSDSAPLFRRKRADSIRKKQERALFTRKSSPGVELDDGLQSSALWREPRRSLDENDELLPPPARNESDLDLLINSYTHSQLARDIRNNITEAVAEANGDVNGSNGTDSRSPTLGDTEAQAVASPMKGFTRVGWWGQFMILSARTWKNLYRNPMLMLTHYAISVVLAVLCGYLFFGVTDDIPGFQNRMGVFFFVLALFGFSTLTSLNVFASERLLFIRERANGYYAPVTYFASKVLFDIIPLRLLPPIIFGSIVYPMVGLVPEWTTFFKFILVLVLFNLCAATICLFIGITFKDGGVANLVGSLVMLFSLLLAGLLLNHDSIPKSALWLQSISIFHYGFEALIVNEVRFLTLTEHREKLGLDIEVPGSTILSTFGFDALAFNKDILGLCIISGVFVVLAYTAMHVLLVERR